MGDVVDIADRLRVWHACDLECPCTHQWFAAVPEALLERRHRCPECGRQTGQVTQKGDGARTRDEARAIVEIAMVGATQGPAAAEALIESRAPKGPPPPDAA